MSWTVFGRLIAAVTNFSFFLALHHTNVNLLWICQHRNGRITTEQLFFFITQIYKPSLSVEHMTYNALCRALLQAFEQVIHRTWRNLTACPTSSDSCRVSPCQLLEPGENECTHIYAIENVQYDSFIRFFFISICTDYQLFKTLNVVMDIVKNSFNKTENIIIESHLVHIFAIFVMKIVLLSWSSDQFHK